MELNRLLNFDDNFEETITKSVSSELPGIVSSKHHRKIWTVHNRLKSNFYYRTNIDLVSGFTLENSKNYNNQERLSHIQKQYLRNSYWGVQKRIFDIFISFIAIVFVLSWVFPILFVLIKLESKGPLLFRQKRNGLNESEFDCLKFRSMHINQYSDSVPTQKDDPRVTKVGKIIRKLSIDELPQFLNVFLGDMSVVGPRPHMISETAAFNSISNEFYQRHLVKPGITGLAQINNCRGEISNIDDLNERLRFDILYIKNASILNDFLIVFRTIVNVFIGDEKAK